MNFSGFIFAAEDTHAYHERYDFLIEVARYLDEHDFTALWTPERHFQRFGGSFPNPAVLSAALAAVTRNLHLRAGSVVAPHHHAVRIAEEWALVDQISKGRTGICFATGWHKRDFVFFPEHYAERRQVTADKIKQVRALWAGQKVNFSIDGEQLEVNTYPTPYQREIPLWLVFTSNPDIWTQAGERGFNVLALLNSWDIIEENIKRYRLARERGGHDPAAGTVTIGLHTFIGENKEAVRQQVEEPLKAYLASFLVAKNDDKRISSARAPMTEEEKQLLLNGAFEDFFENRSLLGDLEKCKRTVDRLQRIGVDEVACLIDFGVEFDRVYKALDNLTLLKNMYGQDNGDSKSQNVDDFSWYFER